MVNEERVVHLKSWGLNGLSWVFESRRGSHWFSRDEMRDLVFLLLLMKLKKVERSDSKRADHSWRSNSASGFHFEVSSHIFGWSSPLSGLDEIELEMARASSTEQSGKKKWFSMQKLIWFTKTPTCSWWTSPLQSQFTPAGATSITASSTSSKRSMESQKSIQFTESISKLLESQF